MGDEAAFRADFATIDNGNIVEVVSLFTRFIRQANAGAAPLEMMRALTRGLLTLPEQGRLTVIAK
ncbi:MAG: hypothetical protein U0401_25780 [Anaerolineae bacterium]